MVKNGGHVVDSLLVTVSEPRLDSESLCNLWCPDHDSNIGPRSGSGVEPNGHLVGVFLFEERKQLARESALEFNRIRRSIALTPGS